MKSKIIKMTSKIILITISMVNILGGTTVAFASNDYDYSNPIYEEGVEDNFLYDSTDSVIITKKNVPRTLPEVTGLYEIDKYPIPEVNKVPDEATFELIKQENKNIMDNVENDIKNGTLKKHKAADGQFYGTVPNDALGVEKKIYINTNSKKSHSLASYVPAGEIATVKLNDEALSYAKKGKIKISVGMTMVDAVNYNHNNSINNRMPYLGKTFSITESETRVGTPFGGMLYLDIDESIPSGLKLEVDVKGVVDTPYYDLGRTTYDEWQESKNAPGVFAEVRSPYLRFLIPAKFIRGINDPYKAVKFWTNVAALSSNIMALQYRTTPMSLIFDQYIETGSAFASVGAWTCNLPPDWGTNAVDYDMIMSTGGWGIIHEINHHYQSRYLGYGDDWGLGDPNLFGEITNNALSAISYILYTNIAEYRGEEGTQDWNKVADPYSSLKQQIYEGDNYYVGEPNMGNFMYSTFAHEIGPVTFANVIKSTYDGGTFNGIYIPPYDYKGQNEGKQSRDVRYDDLAYRICVASGRDYTWYMTKELLWPLKQETINEIKKLNYKEIIPVQSVYGIGEVGRETGRPFFIPSTGYTFDFAKSLVSPGDVTIVDISKPKYGTLTKTNDGKYKYTPSSSMPENAKDEFILTVKVKKDSIEHETKINCTIGVDYNSSNVEKFAITKWDIYDALKDVETATPYATSTSIGMKIDCDDGNNLARSKGYFVLDEDGEYEFQVFGDDNTAFKLHLEDGTTLMSLTEDYSRDAESAYNLNNSKNFTVNLKANKAYEYTLIANNKSGIGWADVAIRKTSGDKSWKSIKQVYSDLRDFGKKTDRTFEMPKPIYVRPPVLAAESGTIVNGLKVLSTPKGVDPNNPASKNEADPNNMIDGNLDSYFHSSYSDDKTPFPHEYIFDLGGEKSFNNLEIYTRRTGEEAGVIGNYEIYVADEYNEGNTVWKKIAEDKTRKGNSNAPKDLKISLPQTTAKYLKVKALNNRGDYELTIIAEVKLSTETNVKNVIAQNSSFIQYEGDWKKNLGGAYVNGATYNTSDGYFMYCFEGKESNIYVTKDVEVEMRVNGGKWQKANLKGSLREPSITLNMGTKSKNVVEVRGIGEEIALNMISTDGDFYKGKAPAKSNPPVINGADNIEIGVGQVDKFDLKAGITVTDDNDTLTIDNVTITGSLEKPEAGKNKVSKITYSVKDSDRNETVVKREITVTNQVPIISGLDDITIKRGNTFDLSKGVKANDYEDKDITNKIVYPTEDISMLDGGSYKLIYSVEDSDGNVTKASRNLHILSNDSPMIIGADNVEIGVGTVDSFDKMAGVSYIDDDTNDLQINVSGKIGKPKAGTNEKYNLVYSVTDTDGNTTTVTRVITVTNQVPVISGLDDIIIKAGTKFNLKKDITASDYEDKDITDKIVYPGEDITALNIGDYKLKYSVKDSDGNTTEALRNIKIISNNAPIITGVTDIEIGIGKVDSFDLRDGINITDDNDKLTINDIIITGTIEKPLPGENKLSKIIYYAKDKDNNETIVEREITVTNQVPVISGLDDINIRNGNKFDLRKDVTANDYEDKDITKNIVYPTEDVSKLGIGSYKLKYSVKDSDGNVTETLRTVNILSNDAPIILGANNVKIGIGKVDSFDLKAGITVSDDNDILTINDVIITGTIEKPLPGENKVSKIIYSVTDRDENTTTITREITVTNQKPKINGLTDIIIKQGGNFDLVKDITATDLEDGDLKDSIGIEDIKLNDLLEGTYYIKYSVVDSDGNITEEKRKVVVLNNSNNDNNDININNDENNSSNNVSGNTNSGSVNNSNNVINKNDISNNNITNSTLNNGNVNNDNDDTTNNTNGTSDINKKLEENNILLEENHESDEIIYDEELPNKRDEEVEALEVVENNKLIIPIVVAVGSISGLIILLKKRFKIK